MTTVLVAALITALGFGGLIALRYGRTRSRFGLAVAAVIALETIVLGLLFIVLSLGQIGAVALIAGVPLKPLALQSGGFGIAAAVLGIIFIIITRSFGAGHRKIEAVLLGLLTPLAVGVLIVGMWAAQDVTNRRAAMALFIEPAPTPTPAPTVTPVPTSGFFDVVRAFPSLSFQEATNLVQPLDGEDRIFVSEKEGRVLSFLKGQHATEPTVFLDLTGRVGIEGNEEGLLGLAFSPRFRENGYFYVYYSASNPRRSVISRFSVSESNSEMADDQSEVIILEVPQPSKLHNAGQLAFGPDGYLYISLGDGGPSNQDNAQNVTNLLGSILRIDPSAASGRQKYRIPEDNPFFGLTIARPEIWAYGLRNPWRFSFDREGGNLWAADVGLKGWEEINLIKKGLNYAWPMLEGRHCLTPDCDKRGLQLPMAEYGRNEGCAVIGGYVYRGSGIPSLVGAYLYGDLCTGKIWAFWYDGNSITKHELLVDTDLAISSFGQDQAGNIYILTFESGYSSGIYQLVANR